MKDAKFGDLSVRLRQNLNASRIYSFLKHISEVSFHKTTHEIKRMHVEDMRVGMRIVSGKWYEKTSLYRKINCLHNDAISARSCDS